MDEDRRWQTTAPYEVFFTRRARGRGGRNTSRTPIQWSDWPGPAATLLALISVQP